MKLREVATIWFLVFYAIGGHPWQKAVSSKTYESKKECAAALKDLIQNSDIEFHLALKCEQARNRRI